MSKDINQQEPLSKEDLYEYMTYIITGEVENEEHAKKLQKLARAVTTMSDVTVVFRVLTQQQDRTISQLMDAAQVQQRVLQKLGATDTMFKEAQEAYDAEVEKVREEIMKQHAAKEAKEGEENGKVQDETNND